jgi:hypothetical protein
MDAETFDFVIHNGDVAYSRGTYAQFDAYFFPYYLTRAPGALKNDTTILPKQ